MDQLDLLKKDWKKQEASLPKYSFDELSKLIQKRSSSIVKWIFIISVLELIIPYLIHLFVGFDDSKSIYNELGLATFMKVFYILAYIVVFYFIYRFYINYRSISASLSTKSLMTNIIKTRRTVKHYIWFNLALVPILGGVVLYKTFNLPSFGEKLPADTNKLVLLIMAILLIAVAVVIIWLIYQLLYGILLRKLKKNYKELITNGNNDL